MTQMATVERVIDAHYAEVSVPIKSACAHDCEGCAGCGTSGMSVRARAKNPIAAKVGQKVVVESSTQKLLGVVALVYLLPIALFLAGYLFTGFLSEPLRYVVACLGFAFGIAAAILYDRKTKQNGGLQFTIVRLF